MDLRFKSGTKKENGYFCKNDEETYLSANEEEWGWNCVADVDGVLSWVGCRPTNKRTQPNPDQLTDIHSPTNKWTNQELRGRLGWCLLLSGSVDGESGGVGGGSGGVGVCQFGIAKPTNLAGPINKLQDMK